MSVIDEIKQRTDIVEVVSDYLPLQKAGRNFKALCPFHAEKTPSFFIFPERQSWHCFGACATGGDVFSFLMKREGISFGEALHLLAGKAGVSLLPKGQDESEVEELRQINKAAAEWYHRLLLDSPAAKEARDHLARRGISGKTIEDFQLGFSLDSWQALGEHFTSKGYEERKLVAAGLLVEKELGGSYDLFRNRLMFPIRDARGRVIGFGARALDNSSPKYLNSPQTGVFDKSSALYGIERAKAAIRQKNLAVVVEGYMDVLVAHQHGFHNVVASLGTSLTEPQVGILKRLTKNLALALDADAAGEMATQRGIEVAARSFDQKVVPIPTWRGWVKYESVVDAEVKVIVLPQGKDPDEVIKESPQDWQRLVEEALPVLDYTFEVVASKLDLTQLKDRSSAMEQLLPIVAEIKEPVHRSHYLQKLARLVKVDERSLAAEIKRASAKGKKESHQPSFAPLLAGDPLEEYPLSLLLHYPELRSCAEKLSADYFERSENRELFLAWCKTPDPNLLTEEIEDALQEHLDKLRSKALPPLGEEERERALDDCIRRLRERWLRSLKAKEEALILDAASRGDAGEIEELEELGVKLNIQLREVFLEGQRRVYGERQKE